MKPEQSSPQHGTVDTLVHVSARASAVDDLQYAGKVRKITNWETSQRFPIYPPPGIPSPTCSARSKPDSEIRGSPGPQREATAISVPESPSQIPDSRPTSPKKFVPSLLDITQQPPSPPPKQDDKVPSSVHAFTPKPFPLGYQSIVRHPRASSLEPVHLSPPNPPASTDSSISPNRLPNKFPLFTSTPKSKSLKALLLDSEKLEISYPVPKVNSDDITLIPRDLATLFPLSLFRCISQSRELEDWERGFWRVNLSSWPELEKLEFWKRMRKAVESGRFGWIYVLFDAHEEDTLNVFCFGGAAKHVWVLLYVMSTKRTKHRLQFRDSLEKIVIEGTSPP